MPTTPTCITLDLAPLRDYRIFTVNDMRRLSLSLSALNKLAKTLPPEHPVHAIADQVREVVRVSLFADEVVGQIAKRQASAAPSRPRKRPAHLKLVHSRSASRTLATSEGITP